MGRHKNSGPEVAKSDDRNRFLIVHTHRPDHAFKSHLSSDLGLRETRDRYMGQ